MNRGDDFYDLEIYEKSVIVTIFDIKRRRDPIASRRFDVKISPVIAIADLIMKWEIADQFRSELVTWDGRVEISMTVVHQAHNNQEPILDRYDKPKISSWDDCLIYRLPRLPSSYIDLT